jgi:hypothetical protein
MLESHRERALELLYYDAALVSRSPEDNMPLGRAYHHQGKLVSSRSSWDPVSTTSVVYGKAGRESYHGHADWGQVCIDGYGEPLVVDLGAPPGYPDGDYEYYYNYQQFGHNVFVFGENETGGVSLREKGRNGAFTWTQFDDSRGAAWSMDLSGVYDEGVRASRTVVHLLPRVVAVLDAAALPREQEISMRWHLARATEPDADGGFTMKGDQATLTGSIQRLDGEATAGAGEHRYEAPYNKHRLGEELKQKYEPYIELKANGAQCRILTLFAVFGRDDETAMWTDRNKGWSITTPEGEVVVKVTGETLEVRGPGGEAWKACP